MAFRYIDVGYLVREKPAEASRQLRALFKQEQGNASAVARSLGVHVKTVRRWLAQLGELGLDPTKKIERPVGRPRKR